MTELVIVALLAAAAGLLLGWLLASRRAGALASDLAVARTRAADYDLVRTARDAVEQERNAALQDLATPRAPNSPPSMPAARRSKRDWSSCATPRT